MTTRTATLVEFLTARLDVDELTANLVRSDIKRHGYLPDITYAIRERNGKTTTTVDVDIYNPARALAEVEAKRTIIKRYEAVLAGNRRQLAIDCYTNVLEDLATAYADHADYDEEWRP
jgi:hypothetical protein